MYVLLSCAQPKCYCNGFEKQQNPSQNHRSRLGERCLCVSNDMRWDEMRCAFVCVFVFSYIWCWIYHAEMDGDARKVPSILNCIRCILCARHLWAAFKRFTVHRIDSFYVRFGSGCVLFSFGFSKSILRFPTASFSLPLSLSVIYLYVSLQNDLWAVLCVWCLQLLRLINCVK